jgi:hypothetical protein
VASNRKQLSGLSSALRSGGFCGFWTKVCIGLDRRSARNGIRL